MTNSMEYAAPPRLESTLRLAVLRLALPVLIEQLLSYCVSLIDTWLSGRLGAVSTAATSAVGLAGYVSWLGTLMFGLVGIGTTAIVAREWGAGRRARANRVANQALILAFGIGILFLMLIQFAAPALAATLRMEGVSGEIATRYLKIDAIGLVATSVTLAASAGLRGTGDMRTPMLVLGLVNIVNAVCSVALTFGLGPLHPLGVDGIVLGTLVARVIGGVVMIGMLAGNSGNLQLRFRLLCPKMRIVRRILSVGLPAGADGLLMWSGHFLFLMIISNLSAGQAGDHLFAAHVVGIRIEAITYLPAIAWGAAAATLIGQSLGAGQSKRAKQYGHEAARQCSVVAACMSVGLFFLAEPIFSLMHGEPAVRAAGIPALKLLACFQVPLVLSIVYVAALRGAGDTRWPLLMTLIGVIGIRLPVAYVCGIVLDGGLIGAWIGMCADIFVRAGLAMARFSRGRWQSIRI